MPRARKRAPSPEPVEQEPQEMEDDNTQPLAFNDALTWKPGKQIPVNDLLRRLKALYEELESIEQEDAHRETLVPKAQELASPQLLSHKDKGIQAYAMLNIVEMFRLLAPDAPYKGAQLQQIFALFASSIVPALATPSDPYNQQHTAILTSLTTVKSIVLLTDIPDAERLILTLFTNCFDVLSGVSRSGTAEKLPKNLEYHMTSMLCTLVEESASLPTGVSDIILAQFLRVDPNTVSSTGRKADIKPSEPLLETSPAYNMARSVCGSCADKMNRAVGQYFSSVLIEASDTVANTKGAKRRGKKRTHDESEDDSDDGLLTPPAEEDLREVEKAHRLLRELWRSCPDVIQNVVPQVETEIEAESTQLRTLAVKTIGDMIAGIGAAGPPTPTLLDPAAYPSQSLEDYSPKPEQYNVLLDPKAPHAFSSVYPSAYQRFVERYKDKAPQVRAAWATETGRIIATSAGGKGLDDDQEKLLLDCISKLLVDNDERVRLASVQAIGLFDFHALVQKLSKSGTMSAKGSILNNLADRIKDPKLPVRVAAMELFSATWGVAAGCIAEGNERIRELLGSTPSKIFEAMYVNNREINALVQRVLWDALLPLSYPPIKSKQSNEDAIRGNESQLLMAASQDPDTLRAERILVLVRDLEDRAKTVFFALQQRRAGIARYIDSYLEACESTNNDEKNDNDKEAKKKAEKLIGTLAGICPDSAIASEHLKKFAKHHDRRSYQLIRFCYDPTSDYRKIFKAMKELKKRLEDAPAGTAAVLDTIVPLVRSAAILVYNRSHVPAIVEISRTDAKGLGLAANDVLKEISNHEPDVFKKHVHELCESLKKHAPSLETTADSTLVDTLKACAGFARRFPEGMPRKDRDFYKAMVRFATYGTPPVVAKHAVTVIVSSAEKKEMYIKELLKSCVDKFQYGQPGFLSKLAAISQLKLLANNECAEAEDSILDIAINQVLLQVRSKASDGDPQWSSEVSDDLSAKLWALRILVNGLRGFEPESDTDNKDAATRVYKLLNTLIKESGELSKSASTPQHHKAQLRLAAAAQLVKLSCNRKLDPHLTANDFNRLSTVAQDIIPEIRAGFVKTLKKHLGSGTLPLRFYAIVFLYAFEPTKDTLLSTVTWLRSRAALSAKLNDTIIEGVFARLLSLLAHHPDFSRQPGELEDFVEYIMFYLKNAATEANLPMLYHIAQRLKQVQDGIDVEKNEDLYVLSDIAEAVIRQFADVKGWSLQLMPGRILLPSGLFQKLPSHTVAQGIADTKYIPEALDDKLEELVKSSLRPKKRKSDGSSTQATKKTKQSTTNGEVTKLPIRKPSKSTRTPKKAKRDATVASTERRKSGRTASGTKDYAEHEDSQDDEELERWQENEAGSVEEEQASMSPPSSKVKGGSKTQPSARASSRTTSRTLSNASAAVTGRGSRQKKERDIMDVPSDSD